MADKFLEMKKLVITELLQQLDSDESRKISKEFKLSEEQFKSLTEKLLDTWLSNPDYIVMLASVLGVSAPRVTKDRSRNYIG